MNVGNSLPPMPPSQSSEASGDVADMGVAAPAPKPPDPFVCKIMAELRQWLVNPGYTYRNLYYHLKYLERQIKYLSYNDDFSDKSHHRLQELLTKLLGTAAPSKKSKKPISFADRELLHDFISKYQVYAGCVEAPPEPPYFFPPLKKGVPTGIIVAGVIAAGLIALGLGFGRGILDNVFEDGSVQQLVEPILPSGGSDDGQPAADAVCGNNIVESGEACDGSDPGECRSGCTAACTCATANNSGAPVAISCGDGTCSAGEEDSCPDDCNRGELCAANGGVQWQGEVCVCAGFVDQVTICNDGAKFDNVTNVACTPDPAACQSQSGGGGSNSSSVCGNGVVEEGEACEGSGVCGEDAYCIECACIPLPK